MKKTLKTLIKLVVMLAFSPLIAVGLMLFFLMVVVAEMWGLAEQIGETEEEKQARVKREWKGGF
jgi:hypothetical protein